MSNSGITIAKPYRYNEAAKRLADTRNVGNGIDSKDEAPSLTKSDEKISTQALQEPANTVFDLSYATDTGSVFSEMDRMASTRVDNSAAVLAPPLTYPLSGNALESEQAASVIDSAKPNDNRFTPFKNISDFLSNRFNPSTIETSTLSVEESELVVEQLNEANENNTLTAERLKDYFIGVATPPPDVPNVISTPEQLSEFESRLPGSADDKTRQFFMAAAEHNLTHAEQLLDLSSEVEINTGLTNKDSHTLWGVLPSGFGLSGTVAPDSLTLSPSFTALYAAGGGALSKNGAGTTGTGTIRSPFEESPVLRQGSMGNKDGLGMGAMIFGTATVPVTVVKGGTEVDISPSTFIGLGGSFGLNAGKFGAGTFLPAIGLSAAVDTEYDFVGWPEFKGVTLSATLNDSILYSPLEVARTFNTMLDDAGITEHVTDLEEVTEILTLVSQLPMRPDQAVNVTFKGWTEEHPDSFDATINLYEDGTQPWLFADTPAGSVWLQTNKESIEGTLQKALQKILLGSGSSFFLPYSNYK